jgi:hypothetical protein
MRLFKSEWLREPRSAFGRDTHTLDFAPRYGVRVERDAQAYRPPVSAPAMVEVPAVECERAVLWEIARYDRAA